MIRRLLLASLPVLLALVAACAGGVGHTSGTDASVPCASEDECPLSFTCKEGVCVANDPGAGCGANGCPDHQLCDSDDACKRSGEKPCTSSAECGAFACAGGTCVESCVLAIDCEPGLTCNNLVGGCVECTFDTDCKDASRPFCNAGSGGCVECNTTGQCDAGRYCDLDASSATRFTCRDGCLDGNDCDPGTRCERPGEAPGRCVECTPDTASQDCLDATKPYCHPDLRLCVQCVDDTQCGSDGHCTADGVCVACLNDDHCPMGEVCEQNACVAGCRSDEKCPPDASPSQKRCDLSAGSPGRCVDCLAPSDCDLGYKCKAKACVEGCDTSATCPPERPACNLVADRCVECMKDADCPTAVLHCDLSSDTCVCSGAGEACGSSDECGARSYDTNACEGLMVCEAQVECSGTWRPLDLRCANACMIKGQPDGCPSGNICRLTKTSEGDQGLRCTPSAACN